MFWSEHLRDSLPLHDPFVRLAGVHGITGLGSNQGEKKYRLLISSGSFKDTGPKKSIQVWDSKTQIKGFGFRGLGF